MIDLEKAKTEEKIWYDYEREVMNKLSQLHTNQKPEDWKIPKGLMQRISQKWVPLVEVQKLEAEIEQRIIDAQVDAQIKDAYRKQIAEANKILGDLPNYNNPKYKSTGQGLLDWRFDLLKWFECLKAILSQEQKAKT